MAKEWLKSVLLRMFLAGAICGKIFFASSTCSAQQVSGGSNFKVTKTSESISLIEGDTILMTMDYPVKRLLVSNSDQIRATPLSANEVSISALKPGVCSVTFTNEDDKPQTISVQIVGDVRELQEHVNRIFPTSSISCTAVGTSIVLDGHVARDSEIELVSAVAKNFTPNVINKLTVGAAQKISLHVRVVEVSRTRLRKAGIDWTMLTSDFRFVSGVSGLVGGATGAATGTTTMSFNVLDNTNQFNSFIDILEQNNLAKVLSEPTVVTTSGRPASFIDGGSVPVPINTGLGVQSVEYQDFGTIVDVLPIVLGDGQIRLEVRPEVRDVAGDLRDSVTGAPGFRVRRVDTGVEMRVGQTLALAGLIQNRVDYNKRGLPVLMHLPLIGGAFRRVEESYNEIELVILITPQFISEVDESMIQIGPGRNTVSPSNSQFYIDGYPEVPSCGNAYEIGPVVPRNQTGYGMGTSTLPMANSNEVESLPSNLQTEISRVEASQNSNHPAATTATRTNAVPKQPSDAQPRATLYPLQQR